MSHHAIEDLIEDTTHLIDAADLPDATKRDYLAGLYGMQAFYDAGYIHFRVIDILLKYGFVYRIPLENYPAYAAQPITIPGWMENETTGELAYAQDENDSTFLYIDAGSISWKLCCEKGILSETSCTPITPIPLPRLIGNLLEEAEKQNKQTLLTQWYGLLANAYLDGTFGEAEGFPATFNNLLLNEDMLRVRAIAQRNQIKRLRNQDEAIILPILSDEVRLAGAPDKEYISRFVLDLKKSPDAIQAAYVKAAKATVAAGGVINALINGQLAAAIAAQGWATAPEQEKHQWCWYKDMPAGRRFVWVKYEEKEKSLMCYFGMQHHLLLTWQQREADTQLPHWHFNQMVIASLPEERQEDKKFINDLGGWKFDITKPEKTLKAQIAHLIEDLQLAEAQYFAFLDKEFPETFFNRDPERLLHLMEEGEDDTGIVPEYVLFSSAYAILLSFAYYYQSKGDGNKAAAMVNTIREKLNSKTRRSAYETNYLEPFLLQYEKEPAETPMPLILHHFLLRLLMAHS